MEETLLNRFNNILDVVAFKFGIKPDHILSQKRNKEIIIPRFVCILIILLSLKDEYKLSLGKIASMFNLNTHATILNAETKVYDLIETDRVFKRKVEEIFNRLHLQLPIPERRIRTKNN